VGLAAVGCDSGKFDAKLDAGFKKLFQPKRSPQQYMLVAVSSDDPDLRRDAIARVGASKLNGEDWAVKGMSTIALLETDPHTRVVAIRGLAAGRDSRAVDVMLTILNHEQHPPADVRPPENLARWEATAALADLSAAQVVPDESKDAVRDTLLQRLKEDGERHARIAAARGLAFYPHDETMRALIAGLSEADFAVAYQCDDSLVRLTGHNENAVAYAWEQWYAEHADDAFANAGNIPEDRRPPYSNQFEKKIYDTKQFFVWLFPPGK
jgi:hypothetical protein